MRRAGQYLVHGSGRRLGLSPKAELLGRIAVPEVVGNLHWGGSDFKTLFLAASTSIYSLRTKVGPRPEPFMHRRRAPAAGAQAGAKPESEPEGEAGGLASTPPAAPSSFRICRTT